MQDEQAIRLMESKRAAKWRWAIALAAFSTAAVIGGVAVGVRVDGDLATAAGAVTGAGAVILVAALALAWCARPGQSVESLLRRQGTSRDQLQKARTRQLIIFPFVMLAFMFQAHLAMQQVLVGQGNWGHYLQVSLPVLYGWVVPLIVMGWDWTTRKHRSLLDDELTQSMRAQAMILAFVVLMGGATVALALGMWRPAYGVAALPYVLAIGGATAGLRFAWLDREAERGG